MEGRLPLTEKMIDHAHEEETDHDQEEET